MTSRLSQADVKRLIGDRTAKSRAATAAKVAAEFEQRSLSERERKIAEDIFRTLVDDAEVRVREALSSQLKSSTDLPHDIALSLARDVESVALPMLKFSEVLTDSDLLDIIAENGERTQIAIAQRTGVSGEVAEALVDGGAESVVAHLVANETAQLTAAALSRAMDDHGASAAVSEAMARRPHLPPGISERLVAAIAETLEDYLAGRRGLSLDNASNVILQARERATASLLEAGSSDGELASLIDQLHAKARLTAGLILRALCMGDVLFFEMAVAKLARIPVHNARLLIHDDGALGLHSVYRRAGLPERLFPAFRAAVDVAGETDFDGGAGDRARYVERMIERVLTRIEEANVKMDAEDVNYLLDKLNQLAA